LGINPEAVVLEGRVVLNVVKKTCFWLIFGLVNLAVLQSRADIVHYSLNNVILDEGNAQMTGVFSWTYNAGEFNDGVGQFISLSIPWSLHDETDLKASFDIAKSIEITLPGSVHDDGVDITLVLVQPLTPTTSSLINLVQTGTLNRSKYSIGGNGFHDGFFLSGSVSPTVAVPEPSGFPLLLLGLAAIGFVSVRRRSGRSPATP
jgi:hypothetical protein